MAKNSMGRGGKKNDRTPQYTDAPLKLAYLYISIPVLSYNFYCGQFTWVPFEEDPEEGLGLRRQEGRHRQLGLDDLVHRFFSILALDNIIIVKLSSVIEVRLVCLVSNNVDNNTIT